MTINRIEFGQNGMISAVEFQNGDVHENAVLFSKFGLYPEDWIGRLTPDQIEHATHGIEHPIKIYDIGTKDNHDTD